MPSYGVSGPQETGSGSHTPLTVCTLGLSWGHSCHIVLAKTVTGQPKFQDWGNGLRFLKEGGVIPTVKVVDAGHCDSLHRNTEHCLGRCIQGLCPLTPMPYTLLVNFYTPILFSEHLGIFSLLGGLFSPRGLRRWVFFRWAQCEQSPSPGVGQPWVGTWLHPSLSGVISDRQISQLSEPHFLPC